MPNNTLTQPPFDEDIESNLKNATQRETGTVASFLETDNLDAAIDELSDLRSKSDALVGSNPADDLIGAPLVQQEVVNLIRNLITVLEKQK